MKSIAVIGAGITGVTTAYALLERGYKVTVFERERYPAMVTSFANGGQLSASNAEVWNNWSTVAKGMKWLFRRDAPLLVNPRPTWHKVSWLGRFVANIPEYENNTVKTAKLAVAARRHLLEVAERESIQFDKVERGILHFYRSQEAFEHAASVTEILSKAGLERRKVTSAEIKEIEPALTGNFCGGYFTPTDFTGDIHKFTRGLAVACQRRGAAFRCQTDVTGIRPDKGRVVVRFRGPDRDGDLSATFDGVVVCAGFDSRTIGAALRDDVAVYPVKGYSITVNLSSPTSRRGAPWVSLLDDDAKIVTSRLGEDRFRVAGTAEFNGYNRNIRADRVAPLVNWVETHFPDVDTDSVVPWAGLRPMMPNMMPRVGPGRAEGVFYNTGHGHLGWTLSAVTAEMVADMLEPARGQAR